MAWVQDDANRARQEQRSFSRVQCMVPHLQPSVSSSATVRFTKNPHADPRRGKYSTTIISEMSCLADDVESSDLTSYKKTLVLVLGATVYLVQRSRLWFIVFSISLCKIRQHGSRSCFFPLLVIQLYADLEFCKTMMN